MRSEIKPLYPQFNQKGVIKYDYGVYKVNCPKVLSDLRTNDETK